MKSSRRAAALLGTAVAVSSLPLLSLSTSATAAETPTTTYTKTLKYTCDVSVALTPDAEPLVLDDIPITAAVSFALPRLTTRGVKLAPTPIKVALNLGEDLRGTSVSLGGYSAEGSSTDTTLSLSQPQISPTSKRYYRIPKLAAAPSAIPTTSGTPWIIEATGDSPSIPVPYASSTTIAGPEQFTIDSTIYTRDDDGVEGKLLANLSCDASGSKTVAADIKIGEAPTMTAKVTPSVVKARKAGAILDVKVGSSVPATNRVQVFTESGKVGTYLDQLTPDQGNLTTADNGVTKIKLPAFGKKGKRTLKVFYEGDERVDPKLITVTFTVK